MTSLNGNGFSISLLRLVDPGLGEDKTMLRLLDASHEALGWSAPVSSETWESEDKQIPVSTFEAAKEAILPSGLKSETPESRPSEVHQTLIIFSGCPNILQSIEQRVGKSYQCRSRDF
jgi:hypothetical protein